MFNHDRLFKELLSTFFVDFLALFFPEVIKYLDVDSLVFLDKEIFTDVTKGERHEVDLLVQGQFKNQPTSFLIHTETQAKAQPEFNQRMFCYFARLLEKYKKNVYPIVIFSYDSPKNEEKNIYEIQFPDLNVLKFEYKVIQLNRLNWRDFLKYRNPVATALMAKMNILTKDRPKVKVECLRSLANLKLDKARIQLISGFIDTYLSLDEVENKIFQEEINKVQPEEKEEVMQIVTSWMKEGEKKGKKEGKLSIILRQLNRKLDINPKEMMKSLKDLSVKQLDELSDALLDFGSPKDFQQWLTMSQSH